MKNRTDNILLAVFVLTLIVYLVNFVVCFVPLPFHGAPIQQLVLLFFHFIPMFFLQLLLCRRAKLCWRLFVPAALLLIPGLVFVGIAEWCMMAWVLFLYWCAAPAAGCILAWVVYGLGRVCRRGDIHVP